MPAKSQMTWRAPRIPSPPARSIVNLAQEEHGREQVQVKAISAEARQARYEQIKAAAAARGIATTAYLLAGIAQAETGLAQCWSEATWACKGPNSVDCNDGPVIAGSGDGPCDQEQGGLGMFQFDAGTYAATLKKYGEDVLTIAGNVSHAIDYALNMVRVSQYIPGVDTEEEALAWINAFDNNDATMRDQWIKTVTHYYNGCKPSYKCWNQRYGLYSGSLKKVVDETGLDFWATAAPVPSNGGDGEETPKKKYSVGVVALGVFALGATIWGGASIIAGKPLLPLFLMQRRRIEASPRILPARWI